MKQGQQQGQQQGAGSSSAKATTKFPPKFDRGEKVGEGTYGARATKNSNAGGRRGDCALVWADP